MAETIESLKKELDDLKSKLEESKKGITDVADSSGRIKALADSFASVRGSVEQSNAAAGMLVEKLASVNNIQLDGAVGGFANLTKAMLGSSTGTNAYADSVASLSKTISSILGPEIGGLVKFLGADLPTSFDVLTGTTREFKKDVIDLGSAYTLSFDQIKQSTIDYQNAILFANNYTFEGIDRVREAAKAAGAYGVELNELTRTYTIAGHEQSFLSEGFLLAADSGMESSKVFTMMTQAARTMGYSVEDSGKPLVALENIAKATGLPLTQISDKVFSTAQQFSRLGLTVEGMDPVIRRFADNLGPAFKGLAVDEVTKLMSGLERQINTTNAAFLAMQGGLSSPGAGVAEAQLAFEDAFKNPIDIMRSLNTTISGITGGKILKFEEARANPELANQFKIQRDLLAQLTGNTDPQSQRTLMSILADLQSGRQLTSSQDKQLQDALKGGQQKQDERASMQDQLSRITIGLQTQANVTLGNMLNRMLPSQVQGELSRKVGVVAEDSIQAAVKQAALLGERISEFAKGNGLDLSGLANKAGNAINSQMPGPELSEAPSFRIGVNPFNTAAIPEAARVVAPTVPPPAPPGAPTPQVSSRITHAPGEKQSDHMVITFRGTDELTRAIADAATQSYNKTLHGNG